MNGFLGTPGKSQKYARSVKVRIGTVRDVARDPMDNPKKRREALTTRTLIHEVLVGRYCGWSSLLQER
jgi:hypothetical protein